MKVYQKLDNKLGYSTYNAPNRVKFNVFTNNVQLWKMSRRNKVVKS